MRGEIEGLGEQFDPGAQGFLKPPGRRVLLRQAGFQLAHLDLQLLLLQQQSRQVALEPDQAVALGLEFVFGVFKLGHIAGGKR